MVDKLVENLIEEEIDRQVHGIELIASENYVSDDVCTAMGSVFTNKYAEGYPGHRYYGGCQVVDKLEQLAIDRACELFGAVYANVQPHAGSQANRAAIESVCNPGDTILSLDLNHGGHLTHGSPVSFSGKYYKIVSYTVSQETGRVDYDELLAKAKEYQPTLIIAGASAYSREWDYEKLQEAAKIGHSVLMFDMAHTAGLIAAGLLKNPVEYCDIVTTTTHKTLRGPRGGLILLGKDFDNPKGETKKDGTVKKMSEVLNSAVFPLNQGGPLENMIAAKAVCFGEALKPSFKEYQTRVRDNSAVLAKCLMECGYKVVSDGTENHEFLVDLRTKFPEMTGKEAEVMLEEAGITVNKNMVPFDTRSPFKTSGLRLGTASASSRGMNDMPKIAAWIDRVLSGEDPAAVKAEVSAWAIQFPLRKDQ